MHCNVIRKLPMSAGEQAKVFDQISIKTVGWTGAELEKLCLDSARLAMEEKSKKVVFDHFAKSLDGFEQMLSSLICDRIGAEFAPFIRVRFEEIEGKQVCAVDIDPAPEPSFMWGPRGKEFFIRHSNTTRSLDPEEMHRYVQMNWE